MACRLASRVMVLMAILGVGGCSGGRDDETASRPGVVETATEGPVLVTLSATPAEIDIDETVLVDVTVVAEKGVTLDAVLYESALRESESSIDFRILSSQKQIARPMGDGRLAWTYQYELALILPGEYELPGARVSFLAVSDTDDSSETDHRRVAETAPIRVTVRADKARQLSPEELATVQTPSPVELPGRWSRWWWIAPLGALAAGVLLLVIRACFPRVYRLLSRWLGRKTVEPVPVSAHDWARAELAGLAADDLVAKGQLKVFYYRVSGILRGYIERRFRVSAPEMTTEEFLMTAAGSEQFQPNTRAELQRFLEACDLVKYARYEPDPAEPIGLLRTAGEFVDRTRVADDDSEGVADAPARQEGQAA